LTNIHGERFDIMHPGAYTLLRIPMWTTESKELIKVSIMAEKDGSACAADMYIKLVNISGSWTEVRNTGLQMHKAGPDGILQYLVGAHTPGTATEWMTFGPISLKIVWGHTTSGTKYLNVFARHLGKVSHDVGGLLGSDDHSAAATPSAECSHHRIVNLKMNGRSGSDDAQAHREGSAAEASWL